MANAVQVHFTLEKEPGRFQIGRRALAGCGAIEARIGARRLGHAAVPSDGADGSEGVTRTDLEVERVVAGSDLQRAGAELDLDGAVSDDRQGAIEAGEGEPDFGADER